MEFLSTDTRAFLISLAGSTAQSAGRLVLVPIIGFVAARVLRTLALVSLWSVVAVICLSQLGFDVRPILAGAGIVGLVETVTFRTIVLRDLAGTAHTLPNGSVTTIANMTKGWSGYVVDVEIGFKETSVVIKARLKTLPIQQWPVGREYRRRLVRAAGGVEGGTAALSPRG